MHYCHLKLLIWSLKKSFNTFALSVSSEYSRPSFPKVGTEDFVEGDIKASRVDHQSLDDKGFVFSLFDSSSIKCCLDKRIDSVTLILSFLNLFHNLGVSVCLALWYARLRFLINLRMTVVT